MLKSEKEPAAREEFREQNRRQVEQLVMRFLKSERGVEPAAPTFSVIPSDSRGIRRESFSVPSLGSFGLRSG